MTEPTATPTLRRLSVILALVGLVASALLEWVHYQSYMAPSAKSFCSVGSTFDCATVALSRASVVLGLPLPIWGVLGFQAIGFAAWKPSKLLLPLSAIAAVASLALLGVELVAIHSVCLLCEVVHVTSFGLLFCAWKLRGELLPVERDDAFEMLGIPLLFAVVALIFVPAYWGGFTWKGGVHMPHGVDADGSPWIGAEEPKLVLHEYTDYACPHCAVMTTRVRQYLAAHPSRVRVVHHNYARMRCTKDMGELACRFAKAANCAGDQGKYWEMDAWLFGHAPGQLKVDLGQAARDVGLDAAKFDACLASDAAREKADKESVSATRHGIHEAPTYVIDGKKYVGGEVLKVLEAAK